jgi:hypothetical protein
MEKQKKDFLNQKAASFEFLQKINYILSKMRENGVGIMEKGSKKDIKTDKSKKKFAVEKVLFPPEGGVFCYYEGEEHPAKGFMYGETVETVDEVKKTLMSFLRGFFKGIKESKTKMLLFFLLFRKQFFVILSGMICDLNYRMRRVRQKPERYCACAREIYRALGEVKKKFLDQEKLIDSFRNIVCMVLEFDDAYRYPFQDVASEMDKIKAEKDPIGEVIRLIDVYVERDSRGTAEKFRRISSVLSALRFNKQFKEFLREFLIELDISAIKMDEADAHHARFKGGYNWDHE